MELVARLLVTLGRELEAHLEPVGEDRSLDLTLQVPGLAGLLLALPRYGRVERLVAET